MVLQVVHWGRIHCVKDLPWLVRGQLLRGFGILFLGDLLNILFASEGSCSALGFLGTVFHVWDSILWGKGPRMIG